MFKNVRNAIERTESEAYILDKITNQQAKIDGFDYNHPNLISYNLSLNESNQNGIAAVMQGAILAEGVGSSIFPINFSAESATGSVSIPFSTKLEFQAFALEFMSRRQVFFK